MEVIFPKLFTQNIFIRETLFKVFFRETLCRKFQSVQQLRDNWMCSSTTCYFFYHSTQRFPCRAKNERKCYQNSSVRRSYARTQWIISSLCSTFLALFPWVRWNSTFLKHEKQNSSRCWFIVWRSLIKNDDSICASNWVSKMINLHTRFNVDCSRLPKALNQSRVNRVNSPGQIKSLRGTMMLILA